MSVLFSLGVLGFAITFALQQPLFSLIGWLYIIVKRPYQVGDRIAIEEMRGDVVSIDFFVTEVWEIDGDLVSSNQPSGRIVTVPNSTVLSARVVNFYGEGVQSVWNELSVQVAYETDLEFASELMIETADGVSRRGDGDRRWKRTDSDSTKHRSNLMSTTDRRSISPNRSRGSNSACGTSSIRDAALALEMHSTRPS
ncbi:MAG: mechanosensitive ion channel [Halobacteriales archaeon]|nr:mechanosensitive ion channel [Halobacteriales archaeon]